MPQLLLVNILASGSEEGTRGVPARTVVLIDDEEELFCRVMGDDVIRDSWGIEGSDYD